MVLRPLFVGSRRSAARVDYFARLKAYQPEPIRSAASRARDDANRADR
jgi:hypothetical protein